MARTDIPVQTLPRWTGGVYPSLPLASSAVDFMFTAVDDPTDRQTPLVDAKTVVMAYNTDSGAHTITFTSVLNAFNRAGDITAYSVAAGKIALFGPFRNAGWASLGKLLIDISDPKLRLAVITLP